MSPLLSRRFPSIAVINLLSALFVACAPLENSKTPLKLTILSPLSGEVVFTNRDTTIEVRIDSPYDPGSTSVKLAVVRADEKTSIPISITSRLQPLDGVITGILHSSHAAPGDYALMAEVSTVRSKGSQSVSFSIHPPPKVLVSLEEIRPVDTRYEVVFVASTDWSLSAQIDRYLWSVDSERIETKAPRLIYLIPKGKEKVRVDLTVFDSLGGKTSGSSLLKVPDGPIPEAPYEDMWIPISAGCGCSTMSVQITGDSGFYCQENGKPLISPFCKRVDPQPTPSPCGVNKYAYTCPLGTLDPRPAPNPVDRVGFGFEVQATLTGGSAAADCEEGLLTKSTTKADDRLIANPSTRLFPRFDDMQQQTSTLRLPVQGGGDRELILLHGNAAGAPEYPQLSAREWGSDDYDAESESKVHEGPLIRWVDVPSVGTRGRRKVDDKNRFLAFVGSDAGGYCWCEFTVERVWEQSGGTGGPGYKLVDGLRCP